MQAAEAGLERLIVIPYFLTVGLHLRRDLPKLVAAAKEKHPNFEITVGQSLEGHPLMPSIILGLAQEVLRGESACSEGHFPSPTAFSVRCAARDGFLPC